MNMSSNRLTLDQAEAKLISSFASLIWLIPLIMGAELWIYYNTGQSVIFSTELSSVLKTLFWVIVFLRGIRAAETQLEKQREHQIKLIKEKREAEQIRR